MYLTLALIAVISTGQLEMLAPDQVSAVTREWIASIQCPWLNARFASHVQGKTVYTGEWAFRLKPAFAQQIIVDSERDGCHLETRVAVWDSESGIGKELVQKVDNVNSSGIIDRHSPLIIGNVLLPSSAAFFFYDNRPLEEYLKLVDVQMWIAPGTVSPVYCALNDKHSKNCTLVFILDRTNGLIVQEFRMYMSNSVSVPRAYAIHSEPHDIPLPTSMADSFVFARSVVIEHALVSGKRLPTTWRTWHAFGTPGHEVTISLEIVDSINTEQPSSRFDIEWPPGTQVVDMFRGISFNVGPKGKEVHADVLTQGRLNKILSMVDIHSLASRDESSDDVAQITNCAANALYLCLSMLGKRCQLKEIIESLGITETGQQSNLATIAAVSARLGFPCTAVKGGRSILKYASGEPMILHIRRIEKHGGEEHNREHYYVVDSYNQSSGTLRVFDPPRVPTYRTVSDIESEWTGHALVFGSTSVRELKVYGNMWTACRVVLALGGCTLLVLFSRKWLKPRNSHAIVLCLCLSCLGCNTESSDASLIGVIGPPEVDLGAVKSSEEEIGYSFYVTNNGKSSVRIREIVKDCSCLHVTVDSNVIQAGATVAVVAIMSVKGMVGLRGTTISLVFEEKNVKPLVLKMAATVVADYSLRLQPMVWHVPEEGTRQVVRRTLLVHEFLPDSSTEEARTDVESLSQNLRIVSLGEWKTDGPSILGYARQANLTLEFDPPDHGPFQEEAKLVFHHKGSGNDKEDSRFSIILTVRG